MKNRKFILLLVFLASACRATEKNNGSSDQSISSTSSGPRIAFTLVKNDSDSVRGWCYLTEDRNIRAKQISDKGKIYTQRHYKPAHLSAIGLEAITNLNVDPTRDKLAAQTLSHEINSLSAQDSAQTWNETACEFKKVLKLLKIFNARSNGSTPGAESTTVVQCNNDKPRIVERPTRMLQAPSYKWLVEKLKSMSTKEYTSALPALTCPASIQEYELLGTIH